MTSQSLIFILTLVASAALLVHCVPASRERRFAFGSASLSPREAKDAKDNKSATISDIVKTGVCVWTGCESLTLHTNCPSNTTSVKWELCNSILGRNELCCPPEYA